jgi:hypothetical protein
MLERQSFEGFIKPVLAEGFDYFVDIEYPAPIRKKAAEERKAMANKAARNWVGRIMLSAGRQGYRDIIVTEERADCSFWFHILFAGCSRTKFDDGTWLRRWWSKYGGKAYERRLDHERIGGLLRYLVMQVNCPMRVFTADINSTYRRENFY